MSIICGAVFTLLINQSQNEKLAIGDIIDCTEEIAI
jgi:hypothetical protein